MTECYYILKLICKKDIYKIPTQQFYIPHTSYLNNDNILQCTYLLMTLYLF